MTTEHTTTLSGGFAGDPFAALKPPADPNGCCSTAEATDSSACCASPAVSTASACCEPAAEPAGCC
ncbi:hypothetical protein [Catelliglobosispora koreensis]|uniref:hypothetical protein n=1 Tax=Catelliglobosispora koreensis TaxID=129052 RepID=UPI0003A3715D|nr:hypothetical protein [Catelliglobosispora koreensis]